MDEFGISVPHSEEPNLIMAPFLFAPNNEMNDKIISFSVLNLLYIILKIINF